MGWRSEPSGSLLSFLGSVYVEDDLEEEGAEKGQKQREHEWGISWMPGTVLGAFYRLMHLVLRRSL